MTTFFGFSYFNWAIIRSNPVTKEEFYESAFSVIKKRCEYYHKFVIAIMCLVTY